MISIKRYISLVLAFLIIFSSLCSCKRESGLKKFEDYSFDYFDTATSIIGFEKSEEDFQKNCALIKAELKRYHELFNIYDDFNSVQNLKTLNEKKEISNSPEIAELLKFSKEAFKKTNGKTNVALGSVLSIWHRHRENALASPSLASLPKMSELEEANRHTDIESILIDEENGKIKIKDENLLIDVGAIAKGFVADKIAELLKSKNISGYLINLGGNIKTVGKRADSLDWSIGIENPDKKKNESEPYIAYLNVSDKSVVTSGSYQRYFEFNGKSYNHIIDTETLMPSERYLSVSVICDSSAMADALSTSLFCMSIEDGKKILASVKNAHAMWLTPDGRKIYSNGFKDFLKN